MADVALAAILGLPLDEALERLSGRPVEVVHSAPPRPRGSLAGAPRVVRARLKGTTLELVVVPTVAMPDPAREA